MSISKSFQPYHPIPQINLDSTSPTTVLPLEYCSQLLENSLGLQLDNSSGLYLIDTATHQRLLKMNPIFHFNVTALRNFYWYNGYTTSFNFDISYQEMLLNATTPLAPSNTYYLPIQCSDNSDEYVLGRAFMQNAYLIVTDSYYYLAKARLDPTAVPNLISIGQNDTTRLVQVSAKKKSTKLSKGLIAVIVVLCVVVVALVFLLILSKYTARKREKMDGDVKLENLSGLEKS
jgi:hypothetical protein